MGAPIELGDAGPVIDCPIRTAAQIDALAVFDPEEATRFVGDAIRQLCRALGPDVPVLGFAAAPWTLACYLVQGSSRDGFPAAKTMTLGEPRLFRQLLAKIALATARYLKAQIAAGAAAVQIFDTWAGELDAAAYREFELPATQLLLSELAAGDVPVILFAKSANHLPGVAREDGRKRLERGLAMGFGRAARTAGAAKRWPCARQRGSRACSSDLRKSSHAPPAMRSSKPRRRGASHSQSRPRNPCRRPPVEHALEFVRAGQSAPLASPLPGPGPAEIPVALGQHSPVS